MKHGTKIIAPLLMLFFQINAHKTTLLIKIPTRERPHLFFKHLDTFYAKLSFKVPYTFLITCDEDDTTMNNPSVIKRLETYPNLIYSFSNNASKVEAFNKDIDAHDFQILLAAHDDMEPLVKGFDQIIVRTMQTYFPDNDGVLNFHDGFVDGQCNTLPIIGRTFYDRFGYVYNPMYQAMVANVELTQVSKMLNKEQVIDQIIIRHNHPAWGLGDMDESYRRSEAFHKQDAATFMQRRAQMFDLSKDDINEQLTKLWSILICTIEGREESYEKLCTKLKNQIEKLGLKEEIEILSCKDKKGEHTVGYKRNKLLEGSCGKYVQFIDDDDDVHDNFVQLIYEKLQKDPDCVSLTGIITTNGTNAKTFIHSRTYKEYFEHNNTYFRPPNHLNPIRRSIAVQFRFPEKSFGEDTDWAMMIANSELIKTEEVIDTPYYFYLYEDK